MKGLYVIAVLAFVVAIAPTRVADAAPIVTVTDSGINGSGQFFAEFFIEDSSGLDVVEVNPVVNLTVSPLSIGQNFLFGAGEVTVLATVINQGLLGSIGFSMSNVAGAETFAGFVLNPITQSVEPTAAAPEPLLLVMLTAGMAAVATRRRALRRVSRGNP